MMLTRHDWEAAQRFIHIKLDSGAIVYESVLRRTWPGDFNALIRCVEDNIIDGGDGSDEIHWPGVEADYTAMKSKEQ